MTEVTARGPALVAYSAHMLEVGQTLPALEVHDAKERTISLKALHAEAPLAAIFLRHFG